MTLTSIIIQTLQPSLEGKGHFKATNPDMPDLMGLGNTPAEALGDLMLWHARKGCFTIYFKPQAPAKPADTEV